MAESYKGPRTWEYTLVRERSNKGDPAPEWRSPLDNASDAVSFSMSS